MNSRTIFALPYQIARTPLTLVDSQIARRLPKDSKPRLVFDRVLGSYDKLAGRVLADESIARRGNDRIERSDKRATAVALEREAEERRAAAADAAKAGRQRAADKAQQARDTAVDGVEQAAATEREGKQAAAKNARAAAARKKQQADARAQKRADAVRQDAERVDAVADARKKRAQQAAKATFAEADSDRAAAADKRGDANQLGTLTAEKRQARKQS